MKVLIIVSESISYIFCAVFFALITSTGNQLQIRPMFSAWKH